MEFIVPSILAVIACIVYYLYSRYSYKSYAHQAEEYSKEIAQLQQSLAQLGVSTEEASAILTSLNVAIQDRREDFSAADKEAALKQAEVNSLQMRSEQLSLNIAEKEQTLIDQERLVRDKLEAETAQYAQQLERQQQEVMNEFLADWDIMIQETSARKAKVEQELEQAQRNAWAAVDQAKIALASQ